jgi:hypothetical protein
MSDYCLQKQFYDHLNVLYYKNTLYLIFNMWSLFVVFISPNGWKYEPENTCLNILKMGQKVSILIQNGWKIAQNILFLR